MDQLKRLEAAGVKVTYLGSMQKDTGVLGKVSQGQYVCAHPSPSSTILGSQRQSLKAWWSRKRMVCWQSMKPHLIWSWKTFMYEEVIYHTIRKKIEAGGFYHCNLFVH